VAGRDLAVLLKERGHLPAPEVVSILRQMSLGTGAAHRLSIVHRDIKPQNVMVDENGAVVLLDFGLARQELRRSLTPKGTVLGTPQFMAPEQLRGEEADSRSDIYSIGVVGYAALVGKAPFEGLSPIAAAMAAAEGPVSLDPLRAIGVPPDLMAVLERCLAFEPERRFPSAMDLERALALPGAGPSSSGMFQSLGELAGRLPTPVPLPSPVRRDPTAPRTPPTGRPPVILVVDDDPECREYVRRALERTGCRMREAVNGMNALEELGRQPADLVLMDVMMPVLDGFDATRVLKSRPEWAGLPVVLMSAFPERNRLAFAIQVGATDFLHKPLDLQLLRDTIWRLLSHLGFQPSPAPPGRA
jgi:serine/threonine protein kinase